MKVQFLDMSRRLPTTNPTDRPPKVSIEMNAAARVILPPVVAALVLALAAGLSMQASRGQAPGQDGSRNLLMNPPFDKVTLIDRTELLVEPIIPRPLPSVEEYEEKAAARKRPTYDPLRKGQAVKRAAEDERADMIALHTIGDDPRSFLARRSSIQKVEYFEDMLLAEGDRLARLGDFPKAFEHYLAVQTRAPEWQGLQTRVNDHLFREGKAALLEQDSERGLRVLRLLYDRQPEHPELSELLVRAYADRVTSAYNRGAYALGRRVLRQMEEIVPDHIRVREGRNEFIKKAQDLVKKAEGLSGPDRVETLNQALQVWPELEEAVPLYESAFREHPILKVAVLDVPREFGPWVRSSSDERVGPLIYLPLLADETEESARGETPGQLSAELRATDLGRRLVLQIRSDVKWRDGTRPVSAVDVVRTLSDRAFAGAPAYTERWAKLLDRVEAIGEYEVEVLLSRAALNPEGWLIGPVGPAHAGRDGRVPTADGLLPVGTGPFEVEQIGGEVARYRKAPEQGGMPAPNIERIEEIRVADPAAALSALRRGDVALVERIPPDRVEELNELEGVSVGRYARPGLHWIAIDGRNRALKNRTLRRALSYAIDRRTLMEETLLRKPIDGSNFPSDGPFPRDSYANALDVEPLEYDPLLARMLVAAARKELGGDAITLRFEYPSTPEARAVVPKLVDAFQAAGVQITPMELPPAQLERELRAGRRFDLAYRDASCVEPVLEAGPLLCPGYDAPPSANGLGAIASPRMLHLLLQLEQAQDWPRARELVVEVDREARDEFPTLPLWEIEQHYAWRDFLSGPEASTEHLYEEIPQWSIEPWPPRDSD